jgi:ketosteroid isomerase-like protein
LSALARERGERQADGAIALVQRAFEAFRRRDHAALIEITDPEVEFFAPTAVLANAGRCYRGHAGLARYLQDVDRSWARLDLAPEKFRAVGSHVVVLGHVRARAADGFEVDAPAAWVWELRGGKLAYGCVYSDPGEALAGLGSTAEAPGAPGPPSAATPALQIPAA